MGHGKATTNCVLVGSSFNIETAAIIDGRYAAERDAEVTGIGGGGRSRRDGSVFGILKYCGSLLCLKRLYRYFSWK